MATLASQEAQTPAVPATAAKSEPAETGPRVGAAVTAIAYAEIPHEPLPEDGLVEIVGLALTNTRAVADMLLPRMTTTPPTAATTLYREFPSALPRGAGAP